MRRQRGHDLTAAASLEFRQLPHSRAIHAPPARVVRGRVSAIQAFSLSCCSTVSRQLPPFMAEAELMLN
jgi:hypothetical protein